MYSPPPHPSLATSPAHVADKVAKLKLKQKEDAEAMKTKLSVVAAEKLLLVNKVEKLTAELVTSEKNALVAKDAALSKLVATHAVALCEQFQQGAKFAQGLMQK